MPSKAASARTVWDDTTRTDLLQALMDVAAPTPDEWHAIMDVCVFEFEHRGGVGGGRRDGQASPRIGITVVNLANMANYIDRHHDDE
ncbi:Uu.00g055240.m01.CDS01 [Anthostomella pinea]|uniref:Uu.00g055240.m01.CDS01 n=1 Tax=Anthostomella pinea TaxID=933095 RepID=A0AAI8VXG7_9PEZI|nr:Uu.00g055240.m01.CDS01 [Anthostomella pinea]